MKLKTLFFTLCLVTAIVWFSGKVDAQTLRVGDTFDLRIGGVPADEMSQISSSYTVDGDGLINLAYIGKLRAAGLTASQVQSSVERAYVDRQVFTHPTITLSIAPSARFVNVSGAVKNPSRVAYTPDMTVMSAINAASDFNDYAKQSGVRLIRGGSVTIVNCKKARQDPSVDVKVLPGDSIMVPESMFGN